MTGENKVENKRVLVTQKNNKLVCNMIPVVGL